MDFHEYADLFPMMRPEELKGLVEDIKQSGLIKPIVLFENKVLDGRNRFLACGEAGVKPQYDQYKGDDPIGFVVSMNLQRRHLNETQRAVVGEKIANMRQGERTDIEPIADLQKVSLDNAAELVNISKRTISNVRKVKQESPDLMPQLESVEMTANQAVKKIKEKELKKNKKRAVCHLVLTAAPV